MALLDLSSLRTESFQKAYSLNEDVRATTTSRHHVFLSYRHTDRAFVPQVAQFLKRIGKAVYVDFLDEELAHAPSDQTATILRTRIRQSKKLIQLITPNSGMSKWMPWELGLGDGLLGYPHSVTLPTVNGSATITDQDYLKMYGYIQTGISRDGSRQDWAIYYPDGSAVWFDEWLTSS